MSKGQATKQGADQPTQKEEALPKTIKKENQHFGRICANLAFLLAAVLIWQWGVAVAGAIMVYGQKKQVAVINEVVHRLQVGPLSQQEQKQLYTTVKRFLGAYIKAVLSFEFFPRNDMELLGTVVKAIPSEGEITGFDFSGRDMVVAASLPDSAAVEQMQEELADSGQFANVAHLAYTDSKGKQAVRYICIAPHSTEMSLGEYLAGQWERLVQWAVDLLEENIPLGVTEICWKIPASKLK